MLAQEIGKMTGLDVYSASLAEVAGSVYFLARRGAGKVVGCVGGAGIEGQTTRLPDGRTLTVGGLTHRNALAVRAAIPWTAPKLIGTATSIGMGDRLGLATPGHVRAVRGSGVAAILAQQSIREMTRTRRTPDQVMDAATWGVLQEGFRDGFGADADHLQQLDDIDATLASGFVWFTVDPGRHVLDEADSLSDSSLQARYEGMDFAALETTAQELSGRYVDRRFTLSSHAGGLQFDGRTFLRAAVKYGGAVAHTAAMYRHLLARAGGPFELEVSVDETQTPTSTAEHYFIACELARMQVRWVSLAPRFVGRFEKGVDYIGDLDAFRLSLQGHVAVMRTLGPYKLSVHSGSDKFSIYPMVAELAGGLVHLKTAGTSYLEAVRAIARIDALLFREILDFARGCYEVDKATYHVSADTSKVPPSASLSEAQLPALLDDFHARQVLHVTFGSVLKSDALRARIYQALESNEEAHYETLRLHLGRHVRPLVAVP